MERKHVTVLFADLCGSTERVVRADVEDGRSHLDAALRLLLDVVEAFGGTVTQVPGDAVQAVFGAPVAQEDHALRACLAALSIHERARAASAHAGDPRRGHAFRIGIDSGEALVGSSIDVRTGRYRADGAPLHLSTRLQQVAEPGETLVSSATCRLVEGQVDVAPRGTRTLKGLEGPMPVHALCGGAQGAAVAPLARRRQLAPFTGRREALAAAARHLESARDGRMRFVGIRGEAGIGKSRLAIELCEQARAAGFGCTWLTAHAWSRHVPHGMLAELARALLGVPGHRDAAAQREATLAAIAAGGELLLRHWAPLADLLDLGDPGEAWLKLAPWQRRRRLADAVSAVLRLRLDAGPQLVVLDDLFAADGESQRLLEQLLRQLESAPVLVCATYRPDFAPGWGDAPCFTEVTLGPLAPADIDRMTRSILGEDPSLAAIRPLLVDRADGNPFFLEQLSMALVDDGVLMGPPGAYRCAGDVTALRPPASISAVITARVDRVPAGAKSALECAAVLGNPITPAHIARMAGVDAAAAEESLREAAAAGLLIPAPDSAGRFAFRHALVQEVVLSTLARPRRRLLHRGAFEALRGGSEDPDVEDPAVLAQHAHAGEAWVEASECALQAMGRAIARSANRDALGFFGLGLDATGRPGIASQESARLALALRMELLGAQLPLGLMQEAVTNLEEARTLTRELGDRRRESGVALQLAVILWTLGAYERGLEAAAQAESSAREGAGRSAQMAAMQARMMLWHGLGRYRDVVAESRRVQDGFGQELRARRLLPRWAVMAAVNVQAFAADALAAIGDFGGARAACEAAYAELAAEDHVFSRILLDFVQGNVWLAEGRCAEAAAVLELALAACHEHDVPTMEPPILARLCMAKARGGRSAQALALIERAIDECVDRRGGRYNAYYFPAAHATALWEAGRADDAWGAACAALREAQHYAQGGHEVEIRMLMGAIAVHRHDPPAAGEHFAAAADGAARCGMEQVLGLARRRLATLAAFDPLASRTAGESSLPHQEPRDA